MTQDHPAVFGGVDTHKHTHVAAVLDGAGRVLGSAAFDADTAGYTALLGWLGGHGSVERVGVEGTGSYGAGLARHLTAAGVDVVDVNRPNRQMRRRRGKTDTVQRRGPAQRQCRSGAQERRRMRRGDQTLRVARRSAVKARTVAANQIDAVVVTAPEPVKDRLRALNTARTVEACARMTHTVISSALRPSGRCAPWPAATRLSPRRSSTSTPSCAACANEPTRRCWALAASARRPRPRCSCDNPEPAQRCGTSRGVLRPNGAPPAQPRRQPPGQQRTVAHRDGPPAVDERSIATPPASPPRARPDARPAFTTS